MTKKAELRILRREKEEYLLRHRCVDFEDEVLIRETQEKIRAARLRGQLQIDEEQHIWMLQERDHRDGQELERIKTIHFANLNKEKYEGILSRRIPYDQFIVYLKRYTVILLDGNKFETIASKISGLIKDIEIAGYFTKPIVFSNRTRKMVFLDFCQYLPIDIDDFLESIQETKIEGGKKTTRARVLCELTTYFTIKDELEEFWTSASERDKLYFFPFYFYFLFAGIIPMRPNEFCKTPLDCLKYEKGEAFFLRVFGNNKGHDEFKLFSHDRRDWKQEEISIPDQLIDEICWYKKYRSTYQDDGNLFTADLTKDNHPSGKQVTLSDCFDPDALTNIKNQFYKRILVEKKGYKIINEGRKAHYTIDYADPKNDEIEVINLGDIRHIAIINLLRQGCSLQSLKKICHHESVDISLHYGNNIDLFEKASTFVFVSKYRKSFVEKIKNSEKEEIILIKEPQYKSRGVVTYEEVIREMEIGIENGIDMGNIICFSERIIESYNALRNEPMQFVLDTSDCRPSYLKNPKDPCLSCKFSKPKKQSIKTVDALIRKNLTIDYESIVRTIPTISGGTLADMDSEILEKLEDMSDLTDIQRLNEVKRYYG